MDNAWQYQENRSNDGTIGIPTDIITAPSGVPSSVDNTMDTNGNGSLAGRRSSRSRSPQDRGRDFEASNTGNTIHVSGLNYKVDGRDLENAFAKVGRVTKAYVVYDSHTHESRQFGFVMMETSEEADAAITALDGTELMGKVIAVAKARRARPRTPTPGKYHGPSKRREYGFHRPYDPRPYDPRYSRDHDRDYDRDYDRRDRYYDRRYEGGDRNRGYDIDWEYDRGGGGGGGGGRDRYRDRY